MFVPYVRVCTYSGAHLWLHSWHDTVGEFSRFLPEILKQAFAPHSSTISVTVTTPRFALTVQSFPFNISSSFSDLETPENKHTDIIFAAYDTSWGNLIIDNWWWSWPNRRIHDILLNIYVVWTYKLSHEYANISLWPSMNMQTFRFGQDGWARRWRKHSQLMRSTDHGSGDDLEDRFRHLLRQADRWRSSIGTCAWRPCATYFSRESIYKY